jgi:hypothetical protein
MARTTATEVKEIITTSLSDAAVTAYIGIANRMVTANLSEQELSDETLEDIECWLTAHLIAVTKERFTTGEKIGDASVNYAGIFGEGLKSTSYGQMVLMLDTSGTMGVSGKQKVYFKAIKSFDDTEEDS